MRKPTPRRGRRSGGAGGGTTASSFPDARVAEFAQAFFEVRLRSAALASRTAPVPIMARLLGSDGGRLMDDADVVDAVRIRVDVGQAGTVGVLGRSPTAMPPTAEARDDSDGREGQGRRQGAIGPEGQRGGGGFEGRELSARSDLPDIDHRLRAGIRGRGGRRPRPPTHRWRPGLGSRRPEAATPHGIRVQESVSPTDRRRRAGDGRRVSRPQVRRRADRDRARSRPRRPRSVWRGDRSLDPVAGPRREATVRWGRRRTTCLLGPCGTTRWSSRFLTGSRRRGRAGARRCGSRRHAGPAHRPVWSIPIREAR